MDWEELIRGVATLFGQQPQQPNFRTPPFVPGQMPPTAPPPSMPTSPPPVTPEAATRPRVVDRPRIVGGEQVTEQLPDSLPSRPRVTGPEAILYDKSIFHDQGRHVGAGNRWKHGLLGAGLGALAAAGKDPTLAGVLGGAGMGAAAGAIDPASADFMYNRQIVRPEYDRERDRTFGIEEQRLKQRGLRANVEGAEMAPQVQREELGLRRQSIEAQIANQNRQQGNIDRNFDYQRQQDERQFDWQKSQAGQQQKNWEAEYGRRQMETQINQQEADQKAQAARQTSAIARRTLAPDVEAQVRTSAEAGVKRALGSQDMMGIENDYFNKILAQYPQYKELKKAFDKATSTPPYYVDEKIVKGIEEIEDKARKGAQERAKYDQGRIQNLLELMYRKTAIRRQEDPNFVPAAPGTVIYRSQLPGIAQGLNASEYETELALRGYGFILQDDPAPAISR